MGLIREFDFQDNGRQGVFAISIVDETVGGPAHRQKLIKFAKNNISIDFQSMSNEELEQAIGQLAMLEDLATVEMTEVPQATRDFYAGQQVVFGLFMVPYKPIPQVDEETQERYFGFFSPEAVVQAQRVFSREGLGPNKFNINHNKNDYISEITLLENEIIVDPQRSKAASFGIIAPPGSWFGGLEIRNKELFDSISSEAGFSVESILIERAFERLN